ncbi:uncharacterized protein LOC134235122 [Saccostrea cucullata]|uniref:uncharacterized protein LOC134235122 n=1 Tax=Saccostrea cuccullata TaxID=36930 RepID=UPI002ED69EC5
MVGINCLIVIGTIWTLTLADPDPILHCLLCRNVKNGMDPCVYLSECSSECYVSTTTSTDGSVVRNFGCAPRQDCMLPPSAVGRRQATTQTTRTTFCKKELCNSDLSRFQEPSTDPCVDATPTECHDHSKLSVLCSDCEYAQYCRKSCGICQNNAHNGVWYENVVLFDYDPVHRTCRHSSSVDPTICRSITQSNHKIVPVMENNTTLNHAHAKHDYLILPYHDSYINLNFRTNGEPLTSIQLSACQTTGHGRVDILLNNNAIKQSYTGTDVWNLRWQIHKLNTFNLNNTSTFDLKIQKDSVTHSYGHYWISRIRVESIVAHHIH